MDNKRKDIMEAASMLFLQKGIKATTVEEIAKKCHISKKTFYYFFVDKEVVIIEIVQNLINKTDRQLRMLPDISPNASSELISFFHYLQSNIYVFNALFMSDLKKYYPNIHNLFLQDRKNKLIPFFIKNIERGILENIYRTNLDSRLTAELYFLQLDNVIDNTDITEDERYAIIYYINSFFLHGIMNKFGLKLAITHFN
ncbi:TetR/AcrR family transcriptional regulator [Flavobacterium sp. MDT1-60]|uniref:TetR/AcrR family transcriptional regulator n=1 Tax=Flavobacterium sp. MDT1-60 TaxID=1979344 RepID=UPI00177FCF3B|nr:TetR/AcrR family transcriptional regulator [Flavobacterium sp. MDT1-60]QOG01203.1 TetR/AcrR family transcriptional regulator [Flavobacterium sp. MDT1-60]